MIHLMCALARRGVTFWLLWLILAGMVPRLQAQNGPPRFPEHWGDPPRVQTRDLVPLPGGYGQGSSTLARWIEGNLQADREPLVMPREADGTGAVELQGELKLWHKLTLTLDGPFAHERDRQPNPFRDYALVAVFAHAESGSTFTVPGYFAADGNAANSSASQGTKWRVHFAPNRVGTWQWSLELRRGELCALALTPHDVGDVLHAKQGEFVVTESDRAAPDLRAAGRLQYVGQRYLRFAGSGRYFLKAGPDAPETLLAYQDFDGTQPGRQRNARRGEATPTFSLHAYEPHLQDWRPGDPTWQDGKGKGLIGALNYLAQSGLNTVSFLPYNAGGDGDNVWPFIARNDKLHYDCSKLDQWGIVFDHATARGLHLHFKLQETEIDDLRKGRITEVPESLDGGDLGPERKLYCRELIARFAHALALNWNIGEENTQSPEQQRAMIDYLQQMDPYGHPVVLHTYPDQQENVYAPLLGRGSTLTGVSLQNPWDDVHQRTLQWIERSTAAGRPWVVANDEQNPASHGVPPDPGYAGSDGRGPRKDGSYDLHDIRKYTLWGNLMAGGAGVEYYFGYQFPQNDLNLEDFRSRAESWKYCRIAVDFFHRYQIPFWQMENADELVGNERHDNTTYCLASDNTLVVYLPKGGACRVDLSRHDGAFQLSWFNPREGGELQAAGDVAAGAVISLEAPAAEDGQDWVALLRRMN